MIAIHQSQFLPWVPYFFKIFKADTFVVLDDVQFQKNGVQNRNQIKTIQGARWLTLPVNAALGTPINKVTVQAAALSKILKTFEQNYKKAPHFNEVYAVIENAFKKGNKYLHEINREILTAFLKVLNIDTKIRYSSELDTTMTKDDLVIEIIKKSGENEYLSGKGAFGYMDLEKFKREGISVYTYDFTYSKYPQLWADAGFIPDLSMADLICNDLENTKEYLAANGRLEKI